MSKGVNTADRTLTLILELCTYRVPISSVTSSIGHIIFKTKTILVIMIFRDRNSNIVNDFVKVFESKA